jgi:holliday junction resolvase YEN1
VEHYEKYNRPFKLAIDISIWHFQIQSGKGGSNPALRTLYYRLLRLLVLGVQPLFVFDGANKPPFKRNSKTGCQSASLPNYLTKQLLKLFGFPFHTAPGEAEAECALLQKEGLVDAVLSEDVDTLMFGCSLTLRNWTSEGPRGSKSPTHVTVYSADDTRTGEAKLDSDGMILIALMSGGDYIPAGVPRCGIKVACEAARAGFGRDLCRLSRDDIVGFRQWRERLSYELETNESGLFRVKHKALKIPDHFPNMAVLGYYTNPAVSSEDKLLRLSSQISWSGKIDVLGLRQFVGEAFDWHNLSGAKKYVRGLAPALLVRRLYTVWEPCEGGADDEQQREREEKMIISAICGKRVHFDTDGTPELRVMYTPAEIVGINLDLEEKDSFTVNCSESEADQREHTESAKKIAGRPNARAKLPYDPTQPERIWILETFVKLGVPAMVEAWEETMRNPKMLASTNSRKKDGRAKKQGRIESFMKVSKVTSTQAQNSVAPKKISSSGDAVGPATYSSQGNPNAQMNDVGVERPQENRNTKRIVPAPITPKKSGLPTPVASVERNPWTLSKRPSDTFNVELPRGSRYSALGIFENHRLENSNDGSDRASSAELPPTPSSETKRKAFNPPPSDSAVIILSSPPESCRLNGATKAPTSPKRGLGLREGSSCLASSPTFSSSSLPSPSILLSPSAPRSLSCTNGSLNSTSKSSMVLKKKPKCKTLITLRESLDGAWRAAEPSDIKGRCPKAVYKNVEVLDLTQA